MNGKKPRNNNRIIGIVLVYIVLASLIFLAVNSLTRSNEALEISYTDFIKIISTNRVAKIIIDDTGKVTVKTLDGQRYETYAPNLLQDTDTVKKLAEKGIEVKYVKNVSSTWIYGILSYILPIAFILFLWYIMLRSMTGRGPQGMTFTRSPARKYSPDKNKITFKDVAGLDEAIEELRDVVKFLKNPSVFNKIGARMPKGILLVGPPGTGKTLLARAIAGEANVPFFYISGSDFVELFVGVGAARVRDLFNQAKASAPAIIFIDEIDAVGRQRGAGLGGGHDEREQTLNQLLVEMDGFDSKEGIIVLAATNRPDILDKALLRPGRFDKKIVIDPPDIKGREEILKIHMRGKPIAPDVDIKVLARRTTGFVGADLENLVNEASLIAARDNRNYITMRDFEEAVDRVIAGPARKSRIIPLKVKKVIAYHELGHAILGALLPNADIVHKVTIIPRGHQTLGFTLQLPLEDKYLITKNEIMDRITVMLGGRAAEELVFGEVSSGAANDLKQATQYARIMVVKFGMSERLGPIAWEEGEEEVFLGKEITRLRNYSDKTAHEIDVEVKRIITECFERAKKILNENRDKMNELAQLLLEKETITGDELRQYLGIENNKDESNENNESVVFRNSQKENNNLEIPSKMERGEA